MAGLEQLEIHSKSYIVRWVKVGEGHTISWSIQPQKKSINFGIFKHPGNAGTSNVAAAARKPLSGESTDSIPTERARRPSSVSSGKNNTDSTAQDQLKAKGFLPVQWYGKCEADKVLMGTYAVQPGQGGMYGLIFDNTFSKTYGKTATFVLLTYPSDAPPRTGHHAQNQNIPPGASTLGALNGLGKNDSPKSGATPSESVESLHSRSGVASRGNSIPARWESGESEAALSTYHVGVLQKRRRKRGQGYARRFFSLDFVSCTLSYYQSRNSSALRGAIPLSLAAIAADEQRREISIDSGAEVWHLRANNAKDFSEWTVALQKASNIARGVDDQKTPSPKKLHLSTIGHHSVVSTEEDYEWQQVESLVSRIVGTRDAVRRLSKDTAPTTRKSPSPGMGLGISSGNLLSPSPNPNVGENGEYSQPFPPPPEKKAFWKRKSSVPTTPQIFQRSIQSQLAIPAPTTATTVSGNATAASGARQQRINEETGMHEHCNALLKDLDTVLLDFAALLAASRRRRTPIPNSARSTTRNSMDSSSTGEFYDAKAEIDHSQVLIIGRQGHEDTHPSEVDDDLEGRDTSSISSDEEDNLAPAVPGVASLFPVKPKTLDPLPLSITPQRRNTVQAPTVMPPSLIGFLRKNVGKDLSTISMPVSANEPTSLLQRMAEQLEYASLLETAAAQNNATQRLLNVTAFAISQFSGSRAKERAIRKPFNPMLGETYELVRSEKETPGGLRLLVEKVSHRPVVMAIQAESNTWSFSQTPAPTQKFWGKSAELITDGRARTALRLLDGTDEFYSWNIATVFLRNVVVGEKYVEPTGTMTITNEITGAKATVEFKQKGMFGGRSEDVQVETYTAEGRNAGVGLTGTWSTSLHITKSGKPGPEIWHCGDLVDGAAQRYGLTTFAASLNEITEIEKGKLPPTDCRLRPDQRATEMGNLDAAETWKLKLEDGQRRRRSELEAKGEKHRPRWFVRAEGGDEGEEVWKLKNGKEGYWEARAAGKWDGMEDILSG
ncbi:Oxysterol-binding protein-domain-containing protein [Calycina marina]|uniref:Oxysterol-binding protein-domain-containing protein n=1 Tax=Calycina marina TaxID=1763456 RepID=A0A9P7Z094_9HELO|nr:Oxysterol-binding protein-domain-containing protein [Calycina marina]